MKHIYSPLIPLIMLMIMPLASHASGAEPENNPNDKMDMLERRLEMGRHEQLIEVKAKPASSLGEFTTDGCSGGLSVGWEYLSTKVSKFKEIHGDQPPWESCCITHDRAYHRGGPDGATASTSFKARKEADLALERCVQETSRQQRTELMEAYQLSAGELEILYSTIGAFMYRAVRIGGMPCTGLPWRWGYGWPECH